MNYFNNKQWNELLLRIAIQIKGPKEAKKANKGQLFEYLVEVLLNNLFEDRNIIFTATQASHDGSKDFWSIDDSEEVWWAECKNYTESIALTQLAPTMLMAELYEVEHLMFFSYTKLNSNLIRKIGLYSIKHQKNVYIYDDEVLEQLVLDFLPELLKDWTFPDKKINATYDSTDNVELFLFNEKNPLFFDSRGYTGFYNIEELRIGEVYNLNILAINRTINKVCEVGASIQSNDDLYCFEFLTQSDHKASVSKKVSFSIQPCQAILYQFVVRLVKYKNGLQLPQAKVEVKYNGTTTSTHVGSSSKYKCISSVKEVFIGDHYEKIVQSVTSKCMNKNRLSGFMVYGSSGTGKTRILEECYINLIKSGYKVMNFTGFDVNNDWVNVVREIVFHLFSIQDNIALDILCDTLAEDTVLTVDDSSKAHALDFLRLLSRNELSLETLRPYYQLIFEKLRQDKYALIMDNIQSYAPEIVTFFQDMMEYYLNATRTVPICILFSLNTDLIFNDTYSSFLSVFIQLKNNNFNQYFLCEEVRGFLRSEQAFVFLKTLLRMNDFPLHIPLVQTVLARTSLRPKYLEQMANYLMDGDFLKVENNQCYIIDEVAFQQALESVPTDYYVLFEHNYNRICSQYHIQEQAEIIISLLHLFGELSMEHIRVFKLEKETLDKLQKHGIISNNGDSMNLRYVIEHDLSAACLTNKIYPNCIETAALLVLDYFNGSEEFFNGKQVEYIVCILVSARISLDEIKQVIESGILARIPNRLQYGFYTHLLHNLVRFSRDMDEYQFIYYSALCCKYVRDHISEIQADALFDTAYNCIDEFRLIERNAIREHFSFIVHMAENKVRVGLHKKAMDLYQNYLKCIPSLSRLELNINLQLEYAKAYIYNRIFVCGKHEGDRFKYLNFLNDSKEICLKNDFFDTMFENCFDEANLYLEDNQNIEIAIACLKDGFSYFNKMNADRKEKFEVNYYSKRIQYLCLNSEFEEALLKATEALQLLEYNDKVSYHLFFKSRYLKYKIIALLAMQRADTEVDTAIEEYNFVLNLLGGDHTLEMTFFKAKYAYIVKDANAFAFYFKTAYSIILQKPQQKQYALMLESLAVKFRKLKCEQVSEIVINDHNTNMHKANLILRAKYEEFTSFLITYICSAPIKDSTGQDGFFLN